MKKIIIDTNVLISFLTDRNLEQQKKAPTLFTNATNLKNEIYFHQEVLSEFVYVMQSIYKEDKSSIQKILQELAETPGVIITSEVDFDLVLQLWPQHVSDYGDAVIASFSKMNRNSTIATFDQKFMKEILHLDFSSTHVW